MIELAGRTCYKSEDRITPDSASAFVSGLIRNGHGAMLEHGTVYLKLKWWQIGKIIKYFFAPYTESNSLLYVTTNYRVIVENKWEKDLKLLCEPTGKHAKRRTFRIQCDIGVSREANRHRVNSIAEQSTRFCNYSKDKFNNEISVIMPDECSDQALIPGGTYRVLRDFMGYNVSKDPEKQPNALNYWFAANAICEYCYMNLLRLGWKPQQARRVLPLDTVTELVHTAFESDWKHFLDLRCAPNAHPDMIKIANIIKLIL
jgi:thymidylate synthase (FAD)